MHALTSPDRQPTVLSILHLGMAGLFAFVLPFICWGAMQTPGHPHPGPHFVFTAPPQIRTLPASMTLAEWLARDQSGDLCSSPAGAAGHATGQASNGLPAGQSMPQPLVGTLLLLLLLVAARWRHGAPPSAFSVTLRHLLGRLRTILPLIPPPRIGACAAACSLA